jgi:hypothetical protein
MKKVLSISLAVLFVVSLTAMSAGARPGWYRGGPWGGGGSWGDSLGWGWNWSGPCQYVYDGAGNWTVSCPSPATSFPYLGEVPSGTVADHFTPTVQS